MACAPIAQRQMPTAIIVPNVEIATQWREALTKFLDDPIIGQYGGNSKKLSGDIDIVTAQSISRTDSRTDYDYIIIRRIPPSRRRWPHPRPRGSQRPLR